MKALPQLTFGTQEETKAMSVNTDEGPTTVDTGTQDETNATSVNTYEGNNIADAGTQDETNAMSVNTVTDEGHTTQQTLVYKARQMQAVSTQVKATTQPHWHT